VWNASRPTGYGAVPGYQPAAFGNGADMAHPPPGAVAKWTSPASTISASAHSTRFPVDGSPLTRLGTMVILTVTPSARQATNQLFRPGRAVWQTVQSISYNGGLAGYGLRGLANVFNTAGASSGSTYLSSSL